MKGKKLNPRVDVCRLVPSLLFDLLDQSGDGKLESTARPAFLKECNTHNRREDFGGKYDLGSNHT